MRIRAVVIAALMFVTPSVGVTQDQTLADIRQELSIVYVEVQRLKRELSTTGAPGAAIGGNTLLDRVNAIETELQRLTGKTEELEFRVGRVVADGTNRIGDLEFRLVELEGGDVSTLGTTTTLGGDIDAPAAPVVVPDAGPALAVGESADFDAAVAAFAADDYAGAATMFETFIASYPASALTSEAHLRRGFALDAQLDVSNAARAFLESYSGEPTGAHAPEALLNLGISLSKLGQINEACVTLGEVGVRFPNAEEVLQANSLIRNLGCA